MISKSRYDNLPAWVKARHTPVYGPRGSVLYRDLGDPWDPRDMTDEFFTEDVLDEIALEHLYLIELFKQAILAYSPYALIEIHDLEDEWEFVYGAFETAAVEAKVSILDFWLAPVIGEYYELKYLGGDDPDDDLTD